MTSIKTSTLTHSETIVAVKIYLKSKTLQLSTTYILLLIWFTSLRGLFISTTANITSIASITHTVIFSKQEVLRSWAAFCTSGKNECL